MVACKELWVLIIAIGASSFGYSVMTGQMPHYLAIFFGISAQNNGTISVVMFAAICISLLICGPSSDWLIKKRVFLPTKIRKIFETGSELIFNRNVLSFRENSNDNSNYWLATIIRLSTGMIEPPKKKRKSKTSKKQSNDSNCFCFTFETRFSILFSFSAIHFLPFSQHFWCHQFVFFSFL